MSEETNAGGPANEGGPATAAAVEARPLQPGAITKPDNGQEKPLDLEFILDIPLQVTVEVGRTRLLISELLKLGQGSVVELEKLIMKKYRQTMIPYI